MPLQQNYLGNSVYDRQAVQGIFTGALTATGSSQGTALALPSDFCLFTTVNSSTGCILPGSVDSTATPGPAQIGDTVIIVNHGAQTLSVYPQGTGKVANGSASAAFSVSATKTAEFLYIGSSNWAASVSA
jgi:hypothetical protein